jgi:hypothetical protein
MTTNFPSVEQLRKLVSSHEHEEFRGVNEAMAAKALNTW